MALLYICTIVSKARKRSVSSAVGERNKKASSPGGPRSRRMYHKNFVCKSDIVFFSSSALPLL